jgi:tetratricopeptide (TPR) repeat protein
VAKCYGKLERYPEKLETLEEAVCAGKERLGSADPRVKKIDEELESTLMKMLDLASEALQSGRHELSAQLYEALYESCVRNSPKLDASSLIMKAAYSRRMIGETQKALENAVRAHEDKIKFGGEDDPEAQHTLDELLQCLAALGRYEECLPLCERLWERWKEIESERSENALAALSVYANYCREAGQLEKSAELFSRLYLTRREMHGENNIRTLTAQHDLDLTLKMLGKE